MSNELVLITLKPGNPQFQLRVLTNRRKLVYVWFGPLGVNTQAVTMRAATMTRTNRGLYPDIFVVVDSRSGCESCDLAHWDYGDFSPGPRLGECILWVCARVVIEVVLSVQ